MLHPGGACDDESPALHTAHPEYCVMMTVMTIRSFLLMWTIFKIFIDFVTILILFCVLDFGL